MFKCKVCGKEFDIEQSFLYWFKDPSPIYVLMSAAKLIEIDVLLKTKRLIMSILIGFTRETF